MRSAWGVLAAAVLCACQSAEYVPLERTQATPPGAPEESSVPTPPDDTGATEDEGPAPAVGPCADSAACEGGACVAEHRVGREPRADDFRCRAACVEPEDTGLWCADDLACCAGTCDRGLCTTGDTGTEG